MNPLLLALCASLAWGIGDFFGPLISRVLYAAGNVDFWWASLVFRSTAFALVASIVTTRRIPIRLSRRTVAIAAGCGLADTVGNVCFASLYPVVTVLLAATLLHERVAILQRAVSRSRSPASC